MRISIDVLLRHLWAIGASGVGKSTAMLGWLMQLIEQGYGVGLADPNADLYTDMRRYVATNLRKRDWERVVLLDPTDTQYVVGFNPLELAPGEVAERKAAFLATVISKLFGVDTTIAARMQQIMRYTFWLLIRSKLTLLEFPFVLTDNQLRTALVSRLPNQDYLLRNFWLKEFPSKNERLVQEWTQSSLNKIGPLVTDPDLRRIFGQRRSTINFRQIMDEAKVLLVNLSKGQLGADNSQLFGAFVLGQVQLAALSRDKTPKQLRRQWIMCVDEFQNVLTEDIEEVLAESRKYGLSLIFANQYFGQLADFPKLQQAILNTVQNWAVFRVGATDAELLASDMFNPSLDMVKDVHVRKNPTGISFWPYTTEYDAVWRSLPEIQELAERELKNQPDMQFWYKRRGYGEAQKVGVRLPTASRSTGRDGEAVAQLIRQSGRVWGRPVQDVDRELEQRIDRLLHYRFDEIDDVGEHGY